jgi:hypothetical protein
VLSGSWGREAKVLAIMRRITKTHYTSLVIAILMIGIFVVAGFAMYQFYKPASTANQGYQESVTTVKTTPAETSTETSPSQTVTPTARPSATPEAPTPNSTGKPAIIEYSIEIVMRYEGIPEAIFYIPTPDWNISYWGECGDLPGSKAIVNVYSMSWKGGPIQSITFNNTGGEHFVLHGGPGHFYLRFGGVVCSPIEVTAFRFVSMRAQFIGPMSQTVPFTVPAQEWKIAFEVSGEPNEESNARFRFTVHREKESSVVIGAVFNKFGEDYIIVRSGWDRYYLKIDSSNCEWKITVSASQ